MTFRSRKVFFAFSCNLSHQTKRRRPTCTTYYSIASVIWVNKLSERFIRGSLACLISLVTSLQSTARIHDGPRRDDARVSKMSHV